MHCFSYVKTTLFWFRRDLRWHDNAALYNALQQEQNVHPIFIFDTTILNRLEDKNDARVTFIHHQIKVLRDRVKEIGKTIEVFYGNPVEVIEKLLDTRPIQAIYANRDYDPKAIQRDRDVYEMCRAREKSFVVKKDHVVFDRNEVLKDDGKPYTVFTPYSKKWRKRLAEDPIQNYPSQHLLGQLNDADQQPLIPLEEMGFTPSNLPFPSAEVEKKTLVNYAEQRDYPGIRSTSRLGVHLRFGTISIRELAHQAMSISDAYLNELIWRDFYHMVLYHFPQSVDQCFKPQYEAIKWEHNTVHFKAWCEGKTGYPLVDAGMRELNATGFMHNRVRMVAASFLTKHLLLDWRWGEAYFAQKLLDYDKAANVGGWQWAASTGCDAAPYFRIFNPESQLKKFDAKGAYIRKWIPELEDPLRYPAPIVDHKWARERALDRYKSALKPQ